MASVTRANWIQLYKDLQRAAREFPQYNYRNFAKRRVREYFECYRDSKDEVLLQSLYKEGKASLTTIRRQAIISNLYPQRKLVIERSTESPTAERLEKL